MKNGFLENIRKRIILVTLGIVGYYLLPAAIHIFLIPMESSPSIWTYYLFKTASISFLIGFLYLALVKVKPSLVPKRKKYRQTVAALIILFTILSVLIPVGLIVKDWTHGYCITSSGTTREDGKFSGTASYGEGSEFECVRSCVMTGNVSMDEEKFCKFDGLFGVTNWEKTPSDFTNVKNKISLNPHT